MVDITVIVVRYFGGLNWKYQWIDCGYRTAAA